MPVVPTTDKKGNSIDKLACSEIWKAKDSYRQLQDAFYNYMVSHNFDLERGTPKEESGREHIDLKEYKDITNFNKTKEKMKNIKLELPDVPEIADISKFTIKRDEKILKEIIKPKDDMIQNLYQDNMNLHKQLTRQSQVIREAEKYQKERDLIIADNEEFHDDPYLLSKNWLDKNKIEYDKLIVNARKKAPVCIQENIDLFIDDQLNNCIEITKEGIQTIRISNDKENFENIETADNWEQIYKYVQKISDME